MPSSKVFFNFFKHVPDDLVISSTPGMIISLIGTIVMITLFLFELSEYFALKSATTLVVDEFRDEVLRVNFNVTMHQVPCEFLSVDVSDMTGTNRHNISKDILKWRLDANGKFIEHATATAARTAVEAAADKHETHNGAFDEFDPDDYEPPDTNLSQHLSAETFQPFLAQHELTVVNFFAPWCIWCRRFEPVYLKTASEIPDLHFHGHARLAQVDCVDQQAFCAKSMVRAYPTVRMYKDGDPNHFELFTGERTDSTPRRMPSPLSHVSLLCRIFIQLLTVAFFACLVFSSLSRRGAAQLHQGADGLIQGLTHRRTERGVRAIHGQARRPLRRQRFVSGEDDD